MYTYIGPFICASQSILTTINYTSQHTSEVSKNYYSHFKGG